MKEEIEIKVKVNNPEFVEGQLKKKANFVSVKDQTDVYFVPADSDFFDEKPTRKYFRVRSEGKKGVLAFHLCYYDEFGKSFKTDEYETDVNPVEMMEILERTGMRKRVTVTKHRKTFDYGAFEIVLDYIEELGHFIEVEAKDIITDIKTTRQKCINLLKEFGVEYDEIINMGYPDLLIGSHTKRPC